jgi:hypothetical protein
VLTLLATALGWQLFGPFLVASLGLADDDLDPLRDRLAEVAAGVQNVTSR